MRQAVVHPHRFDRQRTAPHEDQAAHPAVPSASMWRRRSRVPLRWASNRRMNVPAQRHTASTPRKTIPGTTRSRLTEKVGARAPTPNSAPIASACGGSRRVWLFRDRFVKTMEMSMQSIAPTFEIEVPDERDRDTSMCAEETADSNPIARARDAHRARRPHR